MQPAKAKVITTHVATPVHIKRLENVQDLIRLMVVLSEPGPSTTHHANQSLATEMSTKLGLGL
jgi:hypothetical protein